MLFGIPEAKWKTNCHTIPFISYDVFQNGEIFGEAWRVEERDIHRTTTENKDAAANVSPRNPYGSNDSSTWRLRRWAASHCAPPWPSSRHSPATFFLKAT